MAKYRFTFVAPDEKDNFACVVTADGGYQAWSKGVRKIPFKMRPFPWRTWLLEVVDDDTPETTDAEIAERLREWEEAK